MQRLRRARRATIFHEDRLANEEELVKKKRLETSKKRRTEFVSGERVRVRVRMTASSRWVSWRTGSHTEGKWPIPCTGQHLVQPCLPGAATPKSLGAKPPG
jgi:hypothetical protein